MRQSQRIQRKEIKCKDQENAQAAQKEAKKRVKAEAVKVVKIKAAEQAKVAQKAAKAVEKIKAAELVKSKFKEHRLSCS